MRLRSWVRLTLALALLAFAASAAPALAAGPAYRAVGAGDFNTCGIKAADGSILCWGDDRLGQSTPPQGSFTAISGGKDQYMCAIRSVDGSIACWGFDGEG